MQLVDTKLSVDQMFKPVSGLNLGPGLFYNFRKDTPLPFMPPNTASTLPSGITSATLQLSWAHFQQRSAFKTRVG